MSHHTKFTPSERLAKFIGKEREDISQLLLLTVGYGLLTIAMPLAVQTLVNNVVMGGVVQPLVVVSVILFFLLLLASIIYLTEVYLVEIIQRRIFVRSTTRIAKNLSGVKVSAYASENPVELMNRYFDVMTVQKAVATLLTVGLTALLQGVIGSFILLFYSIYFAGAVIIMIVILTVIIVVLGKKAEKTAIKESSSKYKMAASLERVAKNIVLSKFYRAKARVASTTDKLAERYIEARKKHFHILLKQQIVVFSMYTIMGTGILVMSGLLVINGTINIGQFVAAELIIFGVLAAFVRFVTKLESLYDMLAALDKLGVLFDLPQEGNDTQYRLDNIEKLKVNDLKLVLSEGQNNQQHISFELIKGQSIALLGPSGGGKSQLLMLLTGLKPVNQGSVQYNSNDLRQVDIDSLRDQVALVDKFEIIDGSILENILLARPELSLNDVNKSLNEFGLLEAINALPKGIDTQLNVFGYPLTSSQLQLLMLVRARLSEPKLLLIDGMLDAMQPKQLSQVMTVLDQYHSKCMMIISTQKTEIAAQFDQQITIEKGV